MHNRHYILINAENSEQANHKADREVEGFGNENNWYSITRVLDTKSEQDKEELEKVINELNKELDAFEVKEKAIELANRANTPSDFYLLSKYYANLHEIALFNRKGNIIRFSIDNLTDTPDYYGYTYDEFGFTNLVCNVEDTDNIYLVEIDMHS